MESLEIDGISTVWTSPMLFFFFVLGSHLPMGKKLLKDVAALLGGLQSPIKWYKM